MANKFLKKMSQYKKINKINNSLNNILTLKLKKLI